MALRKTLMEMEERFWTGGPDFYREHLAEDAVMAFPKPAGILGREAIVESVAQAPRWRAVEIEDARLVRAGSDFAILIYEAKARRQDETEPYSAIVSSVYTQRAGAWQLSFHQQTPSPS